MSLESFTFNSPRMNLRNGSGTIIYYGKELFERVKWLSLEDIKCLRKFHLNLVDQSMHDPEFGDLRYGFRLDKSLDVISACDSEIQFRNDKKNGQGFLHRIFSKLLC